VAFTEDQLLRALLGEDIPAGGSETDTLFADAEISELVSVWGSAESAKARGWEIKAARLSHLVDITEGSTNRSMSKAFDHALKMAQSLSKGEIGGAGSGMGNVRVHRIVRD
jgi:hypothetical protein